VATAHTDAGAAVADGVSRCGTGHVNWYLVGADGGVTVGDAGWPGHTDRLDVPGRPGVLHLPGHTGGRGGVPPPGPGGDALWRRARGVTLLVDHGDPWTGEVADAVRQARVR
jgi:hypothetical protein